jgi:DNA-binding MurR/RpiR family transcriptional regulator
VVERVYRAGATLSRFTQLAVIDMIYTLLISRDLNTVITAMEETMSATHAGTGRADEGLDDKM